MVDRSSDILALLPQGEETEQAIAAYEFADEISKQLRALRKTAGLSQTQLAKKLGVSQGRISQIESGLVDHAPSLDMTARFASACGAVPQVSFTRPEAVSGLEYDTTPETLVDPSAWIIQTLRPMPLAGVLTEAVRGFGSTPSGTLAEVMAGGGAISLALRAERRAYYLKAIANRDVAEALNALVVAGKLTIVDAGPDVIEAHPIALAGETD
ncbi:helix-turn-helix domain-containing protein [Caulobacter mirabilis]|uniref:HTH cro/C1-type domain-containing protein n=1 Tax=Caulobacter mirabilis TaxID=69666 RepID=A0A2D2AW25_9CAUL|nr:helix-turn-helix transcriptional regulator [Caulobacter mirabilis]ATQ42157.1 hypothetical protein CSW64_06880 [Caulobacter mirabilis]